MIYSSLKEANKLEFEDLLVEVVRSLEAAGRQNPNDMLTKNGRALEIIVLEHMEKKSVGTPFEGTIARISGQKFPDIVAKGLFGVEVKSCAKDSWQTIGNSVNESTRVSDVSSIYLLFGQLHEPISFRVRPYEHCLAEIKVTHYPRYLIDMDLKEGSTIFDKIGLPYDELRLLDDPFTPIREYYRKQKKPGESIWWMEDGGDQVQHALNPVVRVWRNLSVEDQKSIRAQAMVLFPGVFSRTSKDKYNDLATWLVAKHGVVTNSLRDLFSAGGQRSFNIDGTTRKLPRIFGHAADDFELIKEELNSLSTEELVERWGIPERRLSLGRLTLWLEKIQEILQELDLGFSCRIQQVLGIP